jgi:hypothetical protein
MAKAIITRQLVAAAAEALLSDGTEPSIISVKARIGGGSYTTVKRYLDQWREEQCADASAAPPLPPEIEAKANDFTRLLWIGATAIAAEQTASARARADAEIAAMRQDLSDARGEIARLEAAEAEQSEQLGAAEARLRETELRLAEANTRAGRLAETENDLKALRNELAAVRHEAKDQARLAAMKTGEADALKAELQRLIAGFASPDNGRAGRKTNTPKGKQDSLPPPHASAA